MNSLLSQLLIAEQLKASRRKCFVSYYSGDKYEVDSFLLNFSDVFIPKVIGVTDGDDFINSTDAGYVMTRLREKYLGDSTVTICLFGSCTHSRRYIDWELKTTLRQGTYTPNGLLGITLPSVNGRCHLPERFRANWKESDSGYAIYRSYPTSKNELRAWIEDAYSRRFSRPNLIQNAQEMFKYSRACLVHQVTH